MKTKRPLILILMLSLLLCACGEETVNLESTTCSTTLPSIAETVPMTTEPTAPLHCALYHPDYTAEQILEYFEEVVLHVEYTDGIGDTTLVQKWIHPIRYRIFGTPTEKDLVVLYGFFEKLNQIPGFPGIQEAAEGEVEQLRISFLEPDVFRASFSAILGGDDATGATEYWYYTDTNEIHSARIGYRTDLDQSIRDSVLLEEIVNTLGITDTVLREDSITYQYSDFNTALSDVDWILLSLLYHPEIQCGMDEKDCTMILERLYY